MAGNLALVELVLRDTGLDHESIDLIAEAIDKAKSLLVLDLSLNAALGAEGARILSKQLGHLKRLQKLDLSSCKLGPEGTKLICVGLTKNSTVNILSLANNDCKDAGAAALGEMLTVNVAISHLDIQANKISSSGIRSLCVGLRINKALVSLALQWNEIDNAGCVYLSEALKELVSQATVPPSSAPSSSGAGAAAAALAAAAASSASAAAVPLNPLNIQIPQFGPLKACFIFGNRIDETHAGILASSVCYHALTNILLAAPLELDVEYVKMKAPSFSAETVIGEMDSDLDARLDFSTE
jgi:hypothetical protein